MNSHHHQVRNPGNKVTTTPPPCLANPLVMSWHLGETICHCMHVAITHLFSQLAVDVPEHLDLPKLQGWFVVDCLHVSDRGQGFKWLSEGLWELDNILPFGLLSRLQQPGLSLSVSTVYLDEKTFFKFYSNAFLSLPIMMKLFILFYFFSFSVFAFEKMAALLILNLLFLCHISNTVKS